MAETTMDYKTLYETLQMENTKLIEQNIELTEELEKYKKFYLRKATYEDELSMSFNESEKETKKTRNTTKNKQHFIYCQQDC